MLPKRGEYLLKDMKRMAKYYQVPLRMSPDAFQHIMGTSKSLSCYFSSLARLVPVLPTMKSLCVALSWTCEQYEVCIHSHEGNFWRNVAVNDTSMGDNSELYCTYCGFLRTVTWEITLFLGSSRADHTCSCCCALSEFSCVSHECRQPDGHALYHSHWHDKPTVPGALIQGVLDALLVTGQYFTQPASWPFLSTSLSRIIQMWNSSKRKKMSFNEKS